MLKMFFNMFYEEKVEQEKETPKTVIANRLKRLGFQVQDLANSCFEVHGEYSNYNKDYNRLFVRFLEDGGAALEDEIGFTIFKFPQVLEHHQICYAVEKTIREKLAS